MMTCANNGLVSSVCLCSWHYASVSPSCRCLTGSWQRCVCCLTGRGVQVPVPPLRELMKQMPAENWDRALRCWHHFAVRWIEYSTALLPCTWSPNPNPDHCHHHSLYFEP